jgi:V/A-type H+-transporting ATPase subunit B
MGITHADSDFVRDSLEARATEGELVLFLNTADDPVIERILTPRLALTVAEYLAFEGGRHVLVVMADMTSYCDAVRQVASARGEVPGRRGYPGYLYSDLACIYERCGRIRGNAGSITEVPVLTMPAGDMTHPVPDLTGYITEGQIVLDRELDRADIYPPVRVLPSLSRLMKDGTGEHYTHADHPALANQLYAAYARAGHVRVLASVVGREGLPHIDQQFLDFGERFDQQLVCQSEARTLEQSMRIGWELLRSLPATELHRLNDRQIEAYIKSAAPS